MGQLSLREKEQQLLDSVAVPTAQDWAFLVKGAPAEALLAKANGILVEVLERAKADAFPTSGQLAQAVYGPLAELAACYPEAGIDDSEGRQVVARFFAVNYTPALYDFLRYFSAR